MEGRLNVHFYAAEYRELKKRLVARWSDIKRLDYYADVVCGPFGTEITLADYAESGTPLLRISNIAADGTLDLSDVIFITSEKAAKLDSTQVVPGDLVISQRGTLGLVAVVGDAFPLYNISANLIAIRSVRGVEPRFLQQFLTCTPGAKQLERVQSGQVQAKITTEDVASILVPVAQTQRKLVAEMQAAREARKQKLRDADELLASLDAYLLETLGLTVPPCDDRQIYAVRLRDIPARFDPHFHHPNFRKLAALIGSQRHARLGELAAFSAEQWTSREGETFRYIEISGVNTETGEITPHELPVNEAPSRAQMVVHSDDLLISLTRPHHGAISLIDATLEGAIASTGFAVVRRIETERVRPDYLWCALHSRLGLQQMLQRSSGGNYPAITEAELSKVLIPLPSLQTQDKIAAEVRRRREQAWRLRGEAETNWATAKRCFEKQLLDAGATTVT